MRRTWVRRYRKRGRIYVRTDERGQRPGARGFLLGALVAIVLVLIAVIVVPALRTLRRRRPPIRQRLPPRRASLGQRWPIWNHPAYIIQVASEANRSTAERKAAQLRERGVRQARVLRSSDYPAQVLNSPGLKPGYFVTFVGPWRLDKRECRRQSYAAADS